jgi:transposase InsO family protein
VVEQVAHSVRDVTRPAPLVVGLLRDLPRSREQLIAENALLRQQLIVAARSAKRPRLATRDRVFLLLLARLVPRWRDAILIVKPETVLRCGQTWAAFLSNHRHQTWACDFLQIYDLWFRPIFAFFIIEIGSRRVVHVAATREPTSAWVTQQLRNATPFSAGPRFIIRDRDDKYGQEFDRAAGAVGARVLKTPVRAPRANAVCERFLGSVRRECLDQILVLGERHLLAVLAEYGRYFNEARPHHGLHQTIPVRTSSTPSRTGAIVAFPVLNGLHHDYRRAA